MGLDPKAILDDIDRVLSEAEELLRRTEREGKHSGHVEAELTGSAFSMLAAAIHRYAPPGSPYVSRAAAITHVIPFEAHHLLGFLKALRRDHAHGALHSVAELVHADTFADYLDMAAHLLTDGGYYLPAAVIAGSTLEAHLRALAAKLAVDASQPDGKAKKTTVLVADLAKVQAFSKGDEKQILAWLDLRNLAAHGHPERFQAPQVELFIDGLRDFMRRVPA